MSDFFCAFEKQIDTCLKPGENFDIVKRELTIGSRRSAFYFIDGFIKDEMYEKVFEFFFSLTVSDMEQIKYMEDFSKTKMPYIEVTVSYDINETKTAILSGVAALIIDGVKGVLLADTRSYPVRSVSEPEKDRSLRGSRDGFVETLVFNTAMLRRRIRDPRLRMEYMQIGEDTKLDIAISYIEGKADKQAVAALKEKLSHIKIRGLAMTNEALSELLVKNSFFNPYPKFKFTERPDYASANVLEGKIVVLIDNSPSVMILPVSFADFFREADDYYFLPVVGSYTRIIRLAVALLTVIASPLYLLLINNPSYIPDWLLFIKPTVSGEIPLFVQFMILEFVVDGMRLASLNTPNSLSGTFGIIGGLLLSEFAITAGWFITEAILIMAFVSIAAFSQPSFEMGYALKFERLLLLVAVQLFGLYGMIGASVFIILSMRLTKTFTGRDYLYPIIPFDLKDFCRLFIRHHIKK